MTQVPVCPCHHSFDSSSQRRNFEGGNGNSTLGSSLLKSQGSLLGDVCMNFLRKGWESNPALPHPEKNAFTNLIPDRERHQHLHLLRLKRGKKIKRSKNNNNKRQRVGYFQDETTRVSTSEKEFQAADCNLPGELSETQLLLNGW